MIIVIIYAGCIPLDPLLTKCMEEGGNFITQYKGSEVERAVHRISHQLIQNKVTAVETP